MSALFRGSRKRIAISNSASAQQSVFLPFRFPCSLRVATQAVGDVNARLLIVVGQRFRHFFDSIIHVETSECGVMGCFVIVGVSFFGPKWPTFSSLFAIGICIFSSPVESGRQGF